MKVTWKTLSGTVTVEAAFDIISLSLIAASERFTAVGRLKIDIQLQQEATNFSLEKTRLFIFLLSIHTPRDFKHEYEIWYSDYTSNT